MSEKIYQIRYQEVNPELAAKLWPFVNAYRPHDPVENGQVLRGYGYERIEDESLMELVIDQYEADKNS